MNKQLLELPPLDAVRGFVAVARRMSITQAAQDLCLTQSAVSRQIRTLEQHFGVELFMRQHRTIVLTEAGDELLRLAAPWLDRMVEYGESVGARQRMRPVTISASIGVTSLWILPRLGGFQQSRPNIDVRVSASNRVLDMKREGIDLAIRYARQADVPPGATRLFGEIVLPVATREVAARAFKKQNGLMDEVLLEYDERPVPWLRWQDWLHAAGMTDRKPKAYLHFNQYDQVIQAALAGRGIALGRVALVLPMLADGRLVVAQHLPPGRSDYAYWLVERDAAAREEVRLFRDWILGEVSSFVKEWERIGVSQD